MKGVKMKIEQNKNMRVRSVWAYF